MSSFGLEEIRAGFMFGIMFGSIVIMAAKPKVFLRFTLCLFNCEYSMLCLMCVQVVSISRKVIGQ